MPLTAIPGYAILGKLGSGGAGMVLAARRLRDGAQLAIKLTAGPLCEQLGREAAALRAVGAPLVPELYETGALQSGECYLVMERLLWPTLQQILAAARGPLPPDRFVCLGPLLVEALAALHARGRLHLDLTAANVFVGGAPEAVRFVDLGLSRERGASAVILDAAAGTPESMSPEQCQGQADLDERADLYSAGVLLYRMLCGRPPFLGSPNEVRQAQIAARPPRPSLFAAVPPAVDALVLRCLAKERERRPASADELLAALREALREQAGAAPAPAAPRAHAAVAERRPTALLHLLASRGASLALEIEAFGGKLAHADARRCVAAFPADAIDNPLRRALRAAEGLLGRGLVRAALVDLQPVAVVQAAGRRARYLSSAFSGAGPLLDSDPALPLLSESAAAALPLLPCEPHRPGVLRLSAQSLSGADSQTQLHAVRIIGRDGEVDALARAAREALAARLPAMASVIGEAGVGKSCVAAELVARLRALPAAQGLELRAVEPLPGAPEQNFEALLRAALELPERFAPADCGRAYLEKALGEGAAALWPGAALGLGLLPADHPAVRRLATAPGALRSLLIRAAGEALRRRAESKPLWVVLDDAQHADDATLDALEYAALKEHGCALWVCAVGRPAFAAGRKSFGARAGSATRVELSPLTPESSAELCRSLLAPAENIPEAAVALLVRRTQGLPLLLLELVRGLKREGVVRRDPGGGWVLATDELSRLPDLPLLDWLAQRELQAFPSELGAHARLCALLGPELTLGEIEGVLAELERDGGQGDLPLDAGVATRRLAAAGLLAESAPGMMGWRHALLRDSVASSVAEAVRHRIHAAALRFYRSATSLPDERRLPLLAMHAARAGELAQAAALYAELGHRARARHAYLEAESSYSRALDSLAPAAAEARLSLLRGRALMRYRIGRTEDSLRDFAAARELAAALGDSAAEGEVLLDEATALDWLNDYPSSRLRLVRARVLLGEAPSPLVRARLLVAEGRSSYRQGLREEAALLLRKACTLAGLAGDDGYESAIIASVLLETIYAELGRIGEAEAEAAAAVALAEQHGDLLHVASAVNNRRIARVARRDSAGAVADQRRLMGIARSLGLVVAEYIAHVNLGELLYYEGELAAAEEHARQAVLLELRHPEFAARPQAQLLSARILAYAGRREEARGTLAEVSRRAASAAALGNAAGLLSPSEEVLVALVELSTRAGSAEEWSALLARSAVHSVEQEPIEVLELHGLALARGGERAQAAAALQQALARAEAGPTTMEPRLQKSLEAVNALR